MTALALADLEAVQDNCLAAFHTLPPSRRTEMLHEALSPMAWHLGHVAFVETYWIREVVSDDPAATRPLHDLFFPELSPKEKRGPRLARWPDLEAWSIARFADNRRRLARLLEDPDRHPLLREQYLLYFLIQHHAMHHETMAAILRQWRLREHPAPADCPVPVARPPAPPETALPGGEFEIGHPGGPLPFDNELPRHRRRLAPFRIARRPVSNAEWLGFMAAGGYTRDEYWTAAGRAWRDTSGARAPATWRGGPRWVQVTETGAEPLQDGAPVTGVCHHEALAFARYAGARLPDEFEWEAARTAGLIDAGEVWEWCADTFAPYPGYRPFPYDGYSGPWFDGRHYVLRGGTRLSHPALRRPSFRNFYTAGTRHIASGLRLAANG